VIQRVDGHGLASLRASNQVIEIAIGIPRPYLFDDHIYSREIIIKKVTVYSLYFNACSGSVVLDRLGHFTGAA
jgi:hypothetical protein